MNRPYYALTALLAVLLSSVVAIGPARCHSATARAAFSSRSLCGLSPRDYVVASSLLACFETGSEERSSTDSEVNKQGARDYAESCGYDPCRDESYDAQPTADAASDKWVEGTTYQRPVCGGNELHCPYFGGGSAQNVPDNGEGDWNCGEWQASEPLSYEEHLCQQAHQAWLAEQEAETAWLNDRETEEQHTSGAYLDESAAVEGAMRAAGDAWKTAAVAMPNWVEDYLYRDLASSRTTIEEQYAEAELQAARDAGALYGPALPAQVAEAAEYDDEYQSLYDLDALIRGEQIASTTNLDSPENGEAVWTLSRIMGEFYQIFEEMLPPVEVEPAELLDSTGELFDQWDEIRSQWLPADDAMQDYSTFIETADSLADVAPGAADDAATSGAMAESLAGGFRLTGQLLLMAADCLESEAKRNLNARGESSLSR